MAGAPRLGRAYRAAAALPLPIRRRAVRALFRVRTLADPGRPVLADLFERVLRLPAREATRRARAAALHDIAAETEWLALHRRSLPGIRRDMARTRVDEPESLERAAASGRPVILAPLHMGAYVVGLAHTMLRFFPGRPLLILRQRDDLAMETAVMERIRAFGVEMRFLKVTERGDFLPAVRFARQGAVVVVFCDLPPSYGAPEPMPMFGLPLSFAFGLATLARLTGATVVPWASTMQPGGDRIRLGQPFEVSESGPGARAAAAALVRDHIRTALLDRPEQWHLWPTLDEYLPAVENSVRNLAQEESFANASAA
ncbi:hypothetical protein Q8W71_28475 [Methylobacterium sp. NEAU 140]|uniref:LpxL/LpxP family acyltransferase n=1 Tax=Methylobacterium sp. NEAU 140 TaxID=3064945 RepID=UPI0027330BCF|nr:hypothetical protein [Methylobacterium sp. NEAU 140]MDP4026555.1 hypothetical protein [Methylobacterium sp. NEAU 140]